jgi:N-acetyl-anhydromuramyl-L-alanine amidase AmpD
LRRHPEVAPARTHIIGHDEYAPGRKTDPGELFDYTQIGLPAKPPADWITPMDIVTSATR